MSATEQDTPSVDVFVSYAREDLDFVRRLAEAMRARGRSVWVDLEGLYAGEAWWPSLCRAIEAANTVVFVLSHDSATSDACQAELDHAVQCGKRIMPLAWRDPGDQALPPIVRDTHWLLPQPGAALDAMVQALLAVLDSDPEWARAHTRWLQRALDWDRRARPDALLLRGEHLDEAHRWLAGATPSREPAPVTVQRNFIAASERADLLSGARGHLDEDRCSQAIALVLRLAEDGTEVLGLGGHALLFEGLQRLRRCEPLRAAEHGVGRLAIDRNGRRVVAGDVWRASLWDLGSRPARRLATVDAFHTDVPVLSPSGDRLLAGAPTGATLLDASTGHQIAALDGGEGSIRTATFSQDGRFLAVAGGARVRLLVAEDGRLVYEFDHGRTVGICAVCFDPAAATLMARSPERLRLWALDTGRLRCDIASGTRSPFWSARFSADGAWIAAARGNRRITIFRSEDGKPATTLAGPEHEEFGDVRFADGDGAIIAIGGHLRRWDWPEGKGQGRKVADHSLLALAPLGHQMALSSGDRSGRIELSDLLTGEAIRTLGRHTSSVKALAWTPDGEHLVSGDEDGLLVLWAMSTHSVHATLETHGGAIRSLHVLPDAGGVVASCRDDAIRVWRFDASLALRRFAGALRSVCVSSAAQLAVVIQRDYGGATLRDGDADRVQTPFAPGGDEPRVCAFSLEGRWLAAIGRDDRVHLVDTATLKTVCTWPGPKGAYRLAWSAAGRRLLATGSEGCVVWDIERQIALLALGDDRLGVADAALSPDGGRVCGAEVHREIAGVVRRAVGYGARIIDVDSGQAIAQIVWGKDATWHHYACLSFAPDGSTVLLVRAVDSRAAIVDAKSGAVVREFGANASRTNFVVWAPDGRVVVTADGGSVQVWSVADGALVARLADQANVRAVAFSHDGKLATTVGSHAVWVWDCATWTPLANLFDGVDRFPASAVFSANGEGLIVIETDGQAAWYPVGRTALCNAARPWAATDEGPRDS